MISISGKEWKEYKIPKRLIDKYSSDFDISENLSKFYLIRNFNKEDILVVKFGQEYNDEDNEILVLPYGEHKVILDQYLYELVILSLPRKRVHPGVEDGTLESEIIKILDELKPSGLALESDPRWEKLKKIKNK